MKKGITIFCFLTFLTSGFSQQDSVFSVVEMFYNTGCYGSISAIPSMHAYARAADTLDKNYVQIGLHVSQTYGDWTDQYVLPLNDIRFRKYNQTLRILLQLAGVAKNGIRDGAWYKCSPLEKKASAFMEINMESFSPDSSLILSYRLSGLLGDSIRVYFYAVESDITVNVTGGENSGRTFELNNVARVGVCKTTTVTEDTVCLKIPSDANLDKVRILGYIQNDNTYEVIGANKGFMLSPFLSVTEKEVKLPFRAYPNPCTNIVYIQSENQMEDLGLVSLYDLSGRLLQTHVVHQPSHELSLAHLSQGIYFVKINNKVVKIARL